MFLSAIFCSLSKDFGIDLDDTHDNDDDKTIDPTPTLEIPSQVFDAAADAEAIVASPIADIFRVVIRALSLRNMFQIWEFPKVGDPNVVP